MSSVFGPNASTQDEHQLRILRLRLTLERETSDRLRRYIINSEARLRRSGIEGATLLDQVDAVTSKLLEASIEVVEARKSRAAADQVNVMFAETMLAAGINTNGRAL